MKIAQHDVVNIEVLEANAWANTAWARRMTMGYAAEGILMYPCLGLLYTHVIKGHTIV
jgi:hypothetical protein